MMTALRYWVEQAKVLYRIAIIWNGMGELQRAKGVPEIFAVIYNYSPSEARRLWELRTQCKWLKRLEWEQISGGGNVR